MGLQSRRKAWGGGIKMSGEQKGDFLERRKFQSETDIVIRGSSQVLLKTVLLHDTIWKTC